MVNLVNLDPFTLHFEKNLEGKDIETIKKNLEDRSVLNSMEESFEVIINFFILN